MLNYIDNANVKYLKKLIFLWINQKSDEWNHSKVLNQGIPSVLKETMILYSIGIIFRTWGYSDFMLL